MDAKFSSLSDDALELLRSKFGPDCLHAISKDGDSVILRISGRLFTKETGRHLGIGKTIPEIVKGFDAAGIRATCNAAYRFGNAETSRDTALALFINVGDLNEKIGEAERTLTSNNVRQFSERVRKDNGGPFFTEEDSPNDNVIRDIPFGSRNAPRSR